jgi:hypothetical protein
VVRADYKYNYHVQVTCQKYMYAAFQHYIRYEVGVEVAGLAQDHLGGTHTECGAVTFMPVINYKLGVLNTKI